MLDISEYQVTLLEQKDLLIQVSMKCSFSKFESS